MTYSRWIEGVLEEKHLSDGDADAILLTLHRLADLGVSRETADEIVEKITAAVLNVSKTQLDILNDEKDNLEQDVKEYEEQIAGLKTEKNRLLEALKKLSERYFEIIGYADTENDIAYQAAVELLDELEE